ESPFEPPRKRGYPVPPLRTTAKMQLFEDACKRLGYHPFHTPAGILSEDYRPPAPYDSRMPARPACTYCGHCNWYGCHTHAKAATLYTAIPVAVGTGNVDLRTQCKVVGIDTDGGGNATGVRYLDSEGRQHDVRARVVILCAFVYENVRLLLLSAGEDKRTRKGLANSSGMVGKRILAHGDVKAIGVYEDYVINGFIGPGSAAMRIDDFNSNNFDHNGLGFIRGGTIGTSGSGTPVERVDVVPPGMRNWGKEFKDFFLHSFSRTYELNMQAETLPHTDNTID